MVFLKAMHFDIWIALEHISKEHNLQNKNKNKKTSKIEEVQIQIETVILSKLHLLIG